MPGTQLYVSSGMLQAASLAPSAASTASLQQGLRPGLQLPAGLPPLAPAASSAVRPSGQGAGSGPRHAAAAGDTAHPEQPSSQAQQGLQQAALPKVSSTGSLRKNSGGSCGLPKVGSQSSLGQAADSSSDPEDGVKGRPSKKPRLVWTGELHQRFINAVNHLVRGTCCCAAAICPCTAAAKNVCCNGQGVKNAVPKTILQLMNVEGMTRENVASHLQKYRQQLKRTESWSSVSQVCQPLSLRSPRV